MEERPSWRTVNETIDSRGNARLPRISMPGFVAPGRDRPVDERLLPVADRVDADRLLELEHQPARIDSTIAGVPPSSRCSGSSR